MAIWVACGLQVSFYGCQPLTSTDRPVKEKTVELPDPIPGSVEGEGEGSEPTTGEAATVTAVLSNGESTRLERGGTVMIRVVEAEPGGGVVRIALFEDADSYAKREEEGSLRSIELEPIAEGCVWRIDGLPEGRYAVAAYQDRNGNGELDKGRFGIPKERYGFSNQAKNRLRPPSFDKAQVRYVGGDLEIVVILRGF